jgi:hypothetical protein
MLTTYIENLSNEIFYEVFDYLGGIPGQRRTAETGRIP